MANIPIDCAKLILEKLLDATIVQSSYVCCFTCIAEDFEKEKEALKAKRNTVEEHVKVAKSADQNIRPDVTFWQEQADKLIEEDTKTKVKCFFGCFPNCKWRYTRGKELKTKIEEIKRLVEKNFESVGIPRGVVGVEYHSSHYYISFKSRELKYKELLEALTNDSNYIIGLQGMGGTGKTTLANKVGKELKESKKFDHVIDTTVSYTPDIKKIQDAIAEPLQLQLEHFTESERPKRLWSRLTNGEKILIILDDVWDREYTWLEKIGIPFEDNHNGCRILITTRNLRTCKSMQCSKIIELELLPKEEAWMLFKNHANLSDSSPKSILDKARKIAKECKGLPIAIAVVASSLKGEQRPEEWNFALKSLQKYKPLHGDGEKLDKIYKCLKYSYDNMKDEAAQILFRLCSVFLEDEEIDHEILIRFSIGAGLVGEIDDCYDDSRTQVLVTKNKLIDSCLLLKTDEESVKMHDLVRDVALSIANEEVKAVNTANENQKSLVEKAKNLKYLLCEGKCMDVFSLGFERSKLEILIVRIYDEDGNDSVEFPNSFFENMTKLRVLYLSHNKYPRPTVSLTQSIHSLTNLRSLYLEWFDLRDISVLRNLHDLETLDLEDCLMDELPCEIAELKKLRLLRLLSCTITRNNPLKVIESCSSLEELYVEDSFPDDSSTMHDKVNLPKLRRFRLWDETAEFDRERNILCLSKADGHFSEETFKHLVQTSDSVQLYGLEGEWKNLIPDIVFPEEDTLNLARLYLSSISQLECLIDGKHIGSRVQNVFSKLIHLILIEMENLKELCCDPLSFKLTLCNLKSMSLIHCPMLVTLLTFSTMKSLVLLECLSIRNCEQLKSIVTDEKEKQDSQAEIVDGNDIKSGASLFPNLITLCIESCPKLELILPVVAGRDVPKLEEIIIRDCVELKYIFGSYQHQESKDAIFDALQVIFLEGLTNLVGIFPEYEYTCSNVKTSDSKDDSKTKVESSVKRWCAKDGFMSIKCNIFHRTHKYRHNFRTAKLSVDSKDQLQEDSLSSMIDEDTRKQRMSFLPRLQVLAINQCSNMKCVFPFSTSKMPPKLQAVVIKEACLLEEVFRSESHKKVEISNVEIAILFKLPSFCQGIESHSIKDCWVHKCPQLSSISTSTLDPETIRRIISSVIKGLNGHFSYGIEGILWKIRYDLYEDSEAQESNNQNPTTEGTEVQETPENELSSSHSDIAEDNQHVQESSELMSLEIEQGLPLNETHSLDLKETEEHSTKEGSMSEKTQITTFSTHQEISSGSLLTSLQKEVKRNVEEEACSSVYDTTIASPIDSELQDDEEQIAIPSSVVKVEPATTKDVTNGDFEGTSKSVITHSESKVQGASENELTSSHVNTNESMHCNMTEENQHTNDNESNEFISSEQQTLETLETMQEFVEKMPPINSEMIGRPSRSPSKSKLDIPLNETHSLSLKEIEDRSTQVGFVSEKASRPLLTPLQKAFYIEVKENVEEENTSVYGKPIASPIDSESEDGERQIIIPSSVVNEDFQGTPDHLSQITKDTDFIAKVTSELEQLVSNKHLALENVSLLIDFLVKNPSVRLTNNAISDRYKGFAYTCLVELLKFLQTHNVMDVLGSNHSEFVGLLQDVRALGFDKNWLDGVERRALFPTLPLSEDALHNILHSRHTLIQRFEDLKHQMEEIIAQQETQLLEVKATLSTPLGY